MNDSTPLYLQARETIGKIFEKYGVTVNRFETISVDGASNQKASVQLIDTNLATGKFVVKSESSYVISSKAAGLQCVQELPNEPIVCLNMGVYEQYIGDHLPARSYNPNPKRHNRHLLYWNLRDKNVQYITAGGMLDLVLGKEYTGSTKYGETVVFIPKSKLQDFNPGYWKLDYW